MVDILLGHIMREIWLCQVKNGNIERECHLKMTCIDTGDNTDMICAHCGKDEKFRVKNIDNPDVKPRMIFSYFNPPQTKPLCEKCYIKAKAGNFPESDDEGVKGAVYLGRETYADDDTHYFKNITGRKR